MKKNTKAAIGVGAGLAAAGVAAYLLTGKKGAKNRAKVKQWAHKMQAEVAAEVKKLKSVSKEEYLRIISEVVERYKQIDKQEMLDIASELKGHWDTIHKAHAPKKKTAARKKTAKK